MEFCSRLLDKNMFKRGFIPGFKPEANLTRFLPPLIVDESEIERLAESLSSALEKAENEIIQIGKVTKVHDLSKRIE